MLLDENYKKILNYFDNKFWDGKTDETNWNYYGLILDWYFKNSILSIDYLTIEDFFDNNGKIVFVDNKCLYDQYFNLSNDDRLLILQNILTILKFSSINKNQNSNMIEKISNVLKRDNLKIVNVGNEYIRIERDDIVDSGSYCNIVRIREGILKKELKPIYKDDIKLNKRLKYEFENMRKLIDCPKILNVYDFKDNTYLMEQGEQNLYKYLESEVKLIFEDKLKIIMDILNGMSFAHEHSIIHRDLHLGNILKIGNEFVICDFGLSKDLSIERSMKSSYTEKNNHLFVDSIGFTDFRKLDLKSDIYSIGKIIDYILTYNSTDQNHIFKTIVDRCICRDREVRYDSVIEIINDIETILKDQEQEKNIQNVVSKISKSYYDAQVHEYVLSLADADKLNNFIVTNTLYSFAKIILKFESIDQLKILSNILSGYAEATGYNGWTNYDIFSRIAYDSYINSQDIQVKKIARNILEECANIRYGAKDLLEQLDK